MKKLILCVLFIFLIMGLYANEVESTIFEIKFLVIMALEWYRLPLMVRGEAFSGVDTEKIATYISRNLEQYTAVGNTITIKDKGKFIIEQIGEFTILIIGVSDSDENSIVSVEVDLSDSTIMDYKDLAKLKITINGESYVEFYTEALAKLELPWQVHEIVSEAVNWFLFNVESNQSFSGIDINHLIYHIFEEDIGNVIDTRNNTITITLIDNYTIHVKGVSKTEPPVVVTAETDLGIDGIDRFPNFSMFMNDEPYIAISPVDNQPIFPQPTYSSYKNRIVGRVNRLCDRALSSLRDGSPGKAVENLIRNNFSSKIIFDATTTFTITNFADTKVIIKAENYKFEKPIIVIGEISIDKNVESIHVEFLD